MTFDGLNEDFRDLIASFSDSAVDFVIGGAFALAFHGSPRASGDIDLLVRADLADVARLNRRAPRR